MKKMNQSLTFFIFSITSIPFLFTVTTQSATAIEAASFSEPYSDIDGHILDQLGDHIPEYWKAIALAEGDLNRDKQTDYALIIQVIQPDPDKQPALNLDSADLTDLDTHTDTTKNTVTTATIDTVADKLPKSARDIDMYKSLDIALAPYANFVGPLQPGKSPPGIPEHSADHSDSSDGSDPLVKTQPNLEKQPLKPQKITTDPNARHLLVILSQPETADQSAQPNKSTPALKEARRYRHFIPAHGGAEQDNDALSYLAINQGLLEFRFQGEEAITRKRHHIIYKFRFDQDDLHLQDYNQHIVNRMSGMFQETSINLKKGEQKEIFGSMSSPRHQVRKTRIEATNTWTLGEIDDPLNFMPLSEAQATQPGTP